MSRYRSRYSGSVSTMRWQRRQTAFRWGVLACLVLVVGVGGLFAMRQSGEVRQWFGSLFASHDEHEAETAADNCYRRLLRTEIPSVNLYKQRFVDLFPDLNDVQLESARQWGIASCTSATSLEENPQLCHIATNQLYVVDSMWHSRPYVVPATAVMLQFIGERFAEILQEKGRDRHTYRPIVTSALRTDRDVRRLRRSNGNASENSCHCYGTTIDITYSRFMRDDGLEIQEYWLRDLLAQTLYELRYEGLCHVRYEVRQPCFHITVRNVEYDGNRPHTHQYLDLAAVTPAPETTTLELHEPKVVEVALDESSEAESGTPQAAKQHQRKRDTRSNYLTL